MFNNVLEAIDWVEHIRRKEKRKDLSRMKKLLDILSHPENSYKKIHIAGTNGKGATCEMITSILHHKGYNVGRFVSPYILKFNERIEVNGKEISDTDLLNIINSLYPIINEYNDKENDIVPFFEVVTLIGFIYFKQSHIDIAVIECGLGGKLDATNVINANASVITSIGYDHMNVLGNTLEEISLNKLGIVKENNHLFANVESNLKPLFIDYVKKVHAVIEFVDLDECSIDCDFESTKFTYNNQTYSTNLLGKFEANNALLAIEVSKFIAPSITDEEINESLANIFWPGRLEVVSKDPLIIIDGAHNVSAAKTLVSALKDIADIKYNVLYTGLKDKDTQGVISELESIANKIIITKICDARSSNVDDLLNQVSIDKLGFENEFEAFDYALSLNEPLLIVGSLHFVSSLRPYIINKLKK